MREGEPDLYRGKPIDGMTRYELVDALRRIGRLYTELLKRKIEERRIR